LNKYAYLLAGVLAGMGAKYIWEAFRLPLYGIKVFKITAQTTTTNEVWVGADDLLMVVIGLVIIFVGKTMLARLFGIGWIIGITIMKGFEPFQDLSAGSTVAPIKGLPNWTL
jgi:hypothetical protein